jgi:hypothetical protein
MSVALSSRFFDSFLTVPEEGSYNIIATSHSRERTGPYKIEVGTHATN